ncbi:MAG: hypothetical protein RL632_751 [Bacteroidota bacterium]
MTGFCLRVMCDELRSWIKSFVACRRVRLGGRSIILFTLLRRGRDYLELRLRWSSLRYGTNPAAPHPFLPSRSCGEGGITLNFVCGGLRCATARTLRLLIPSFLHVVAERAGFEPAIHFWRIHTFQACSFNHSDTSPRISNSSNLLMRPSFETGG